MKPQRPVPPARVLEVSERVGPGGVVLTPLDEASVHEAAAALRRLDVQAVAVCLLHSFAYPAHERRVAELLRAALPDVAVTASVDVLPVVREYERSLATIMNAGVMPAVATYVQRLQRRLTDADIAAPLLLMQSNGGVAGAATIGRAPALTVLSGPAAGVVGARDVAAAAGIGDIVTVDIGGTSADICLLRGGQIALTQRGHIGEWPLPLPMVDMVTIGAGGGSIARLSDGALTVGPASAGAVPGPACYGRGGERADGDRRASGARPSARRRCSAAAWRSMRRWRSRRSARASPNRSGCRCTRRRAASWRSPTPTWSARSAWCRWSAGMIRATSRWCRSAAPARCMAARSPSCSASTRVLVPPAPGVLCAEGLLAASLKAEFSRTLPRPDDWDAAEDGVRVAGGRGARVVRCGARGAGQRPDVHARRAAALRRPGRRARHRLAGRRGCRAGGVRRGASGAERLHAGGEVELVTLRVEAEAG